MRDPKTVFSNTLESNYYQQRLDNSSYMENRYKITTNVEQMTPLEYYEQCSHLFNSTISALKASRLEKGREYIDELINVIEGPNNQFPMCYIDFVNKNQEGLHRMYALGELYGWSKVKFPVLVVIRTEKQKEELEEEYLEEKTWLALQDVLKSKYLNVNEFIDELKNQINREIKYEVHPQIKYIDDKVSVKINGFLFEYDNIKVKHETKEDRDKDYDTWFKEFNEEWDNKDEL